MKDTEKNEELNKGSGIYEKMVMKLRTFAESVAHTFAGLSHLSWVKIIVSAVCLLAYLILVIVSHYSVKPIVDSQVLTRWNTSEHRYSYISTYLDYATGVTSSTVEDLYHNLAKDAKKNATDYDNLESSLYCYSGQTTISISTERESIPEARVIGVGGDYFVFHELNMINGHYISDEDLMMDTVILDEHAAARLFGSYDIVGQEVMIGEVPYLVAGVYNTPDTKLSKLSGAQAGYIYMVYEQLEMCDMARGVNAIEVIMADPLGNSAVKTVTDIVGTLTSDEYKIDIVNNTDRFKLKNLVKVWNDYGQRSMRVKSITYPFYENEARAMEDYLAYLMEFKFLCLLIPTVFLILTCITLWRRRTLHLADYEKMIKTWGEDKFLPFFDKKINDIRANIALRKAEKELNGKEKKKAHNAAKSGVKKHDK